MTSARCRVPAAVRTAHAHGFARVWPGSGAQGAQVVAAVDPGRSQGLQPGRTAPAAQGRRPGGGLGVLSGSAEGVEGHDHSGQLLGRGRPGQDPQARGGHSGMFPCLRGGRRSRLPRLKRSAFTSAGRVSDGAITSSR